jgi:hypothetical protein
MSSSTSALTGDDMATDLRSVPFAVDLGSKSALDFRGSCAAAEIAPLVRVLAELEEEGWISRRTDVFEGLSANHENRLIRAHGGA